MRCSECDKEFQQTHWNQIICSDRCKRDMKNRSNLRLNHKNRGYEGYPIKTCIVCSSEFKSKTSNHKTCSDPCSIMKRRQRKNYSQKEKHARDKKKPGYILARMLRTCLNNFIIRKNTKSNKFNDYNADNFKNHISGLFKPGMSWDNWGEWHIDHIKPLSKFDLVCEDGTPNIQEIKKANSLENLQPLWAQENLRKNNRWHNEHY